MTHTLAPVAARQRFRRGPLVAAVLVGTFSSTMLASSTGGPFPDGPLVVAGGDSTVGIRTNPQTVVAYGLNIIRNVGTEPVTGATAQLVRDPSREYSGVSVEPVQVVEIEARQLASLGAGPWPFPELDKAATPLGGYTFEPDGRRVELLFIVKVAHAGTWYWPKTRIAYETAGQKYAQEVTNGFLICAPETSECDPSLP